MKEQPFNQMPPEKKKRIAYIENRSDLFETKILRLKSTNEKEKSKKLLAATRGPGGVRALAPVIKELQEEDIQIDIMTDGRAQELLEEQFETEDISPEKSLLDSPNTTGTPQVILLEGSAERGLESFVSMAHPETPKILVEDYYMTSQPLLEASIKRGIPLPKKICVIDKIAKKLLVEKFPQLKDRIEITGQPAFDKFATENTEQIAMEVKEKLGLKPDDKLISFMSTFDEPEKIEKMAEALSSMSENFYFAFRRHPRDNVEYTTYRNILTSAGINVIDTDEFSTDEISAASDVVMTTWSTEGLHGIYRRKPTIHLSDRKFKTPSHLDLPLPPVQLGASVNIDKTEDIAEALPDLLNPDSELNKQLQTNMAANYPSDGKNAKRVANVVREFLN